VYVRIRLEHKNLYATFQEHLFEEIRLKMKICRMFQFASPKEN